jgi:hypothetical protein
MVPYKVSFDPYAVPMALPYPTFPFITSGN